MLPNGERDAPSGAVQFRGDLNPACRGADDENPAIGQLARIAVVRWGESGNPGGYAGLQRRDPGDGVGTRSHHD